MGQKDVGREIAVKPSLPELERWMSSAYEFAEQAFRLQEAPVGAVVVQAGRLIAAAHNERELRKSPIAHAEILAIERAALALGSWRLDGCTLYVTLEPCPMCAGALLQSRVPELVFGAFDPKAGACGSLYNLTNDNRLNHRISVTGGVLAEQCGALLTRFFADRRAEGKK